MMVYISIDGDDVGAEIERLILLCQSDSLIQYWRSVSAVMADIEERLRSHGADVLLSGGDTILAVLDHMPSPMLIDTLLLDTRPLSFSVGTGRTMLEEHIALKTAKASGKSCWVDYSDLSTIRRLRYDSSR